MKNKILRKILAFVMLTILLVQFSLTIVVFAKDEESIEYSNAWNDLKASPLFNPTDYPQLPSSHEKYYSLEVITVAESENGELFVYVYQPSGQAGEIRAASIDISTKVCTEKQFLNYKLTYINSHTVFFKYKVEGLKVSSDETRYYEISDILRPWSESYGDKEPPAGNTISEVGLPVGKMFTFTGTSSMVVEDVDYIQITDQYVGYIRYEQDALLNMKAYDAHFVAFSTGERVIEDLLEADVYFEKRDVIHILDGDDEVETDNEGETVKEVETEVVDPEEIETDYAYLDKDSEIEIELSDGQLFKKSFTVTDQIQKTSEFLTQTTPKYVFPGFSVKKNIPFSKEGILELSKTQWVLVFELTEYIRPAATTIPYESYTRVGNVKLLRLKFKTGGEVYNLGVVSNKQTGSKDPVAVVEEQDWWQKIMMVLMLILLLVALIFIWPFISPVVKIIWQGIKGIFKFLIWILMLPSKLFRKIFKLSDQRSDKRRKERKKKK